MTKVCVSTEVKHQSFGDYSSATTFLSVTVDTQLEDTVAKQIKDAIKISEQMRGPISKSLQNHFVQINKEFGGVYQNGDIYDLKEIMKQ